MTCPDPPRATLWRIDDPDHPRFLGHGTAVEPQLVLLHPSEQRGWTPRSARVRVRVTTTDTEDVLDGSMSGGYVRGLVSLRVITLDGPITANDFPALDWPRRRDPGSRTRFLETLTAWSATDPTTDPGPAPAEADRPREPYQETPQLVPPWCWLFPKCPGCR